MSSKENRQPDGVGTGGVSNSISSNTSNVVTLADRCNYRPFDDLTVTVALARLKAGTLDPGVLVALLANAGVRP